jgi:hypothetical protein
MSNIYIWEVVAPSLTAALKPEGRQNKNERERRKIGRRLNEQQERQKEETP